MSRNQPWTILSLLQWTTSHFDRNGIDSPRSAAEILLAYCLGLKRIDLYLQHDRPLEKKELAAYKTLIKRRLRREPVAYIVGIKEFWSIPFQVNRNVLIPRPDSECLVESALAVFSQRASDPPLAVLELGTGSGALVVSLALEDPRHCYVAADLSAGAVALARRNASRNQCRRIHFFAGDWLEAVSDRRAFFDVILANPPYVKTGEMSRLQPEITCEPRWALDGGPDGLNSIRHLIHRAPAYLNPGGMLLLEIGYDQKSAVQELVEQQPAWASVDFRRDYGGVARVAEIRRSEL